MRTEIMGCPMPGDQSVCVCVLVYVKLRGPNVPTRIVKPEIFDIVGTGLREKKLNIKNIKNSK